MNATIHMDWRLGILIPCIFISSLSLVFSQDDLSDEELDALLADEDALNAWLEAEFSGWDFTAFGRLGWGRSNNVLLATVNPQSGNYLRTDFEMFLAHLPDENGEFYTYLMITDLRYSGVEDADKEQLFLSNTEWKRYLGDRLSGTLKAQYVYFDQILDLSLTERQETRQRVQYHGYGVGAESEYKANGNNDLSLGFLVLREEYAEVLGQNWMGRLELEWERPIWLGAELSAKLREEKRDYDDRSQRDKFGRPIEGDRLKMKRSSATIEVSRDWGKSNAVNTAFEVRFLKNRDNGSGYYDFDQWSVDVSIDGDWRGIEARVAVGVDDSKFLIQPVERFSSIPRTKKDYWGELFFRKQFMKRLSVYLLLEYEESNSNVLTDEYDALSGSLGFQIDIWGE